MPRKGKGSKLTGSGAPAGPPVTPVDAPYGEGERALESQRTMPVPAGPPGLPPGSLGAPGGGGGSAPPAVDPRARLQAALQAMSAMRPPRGLTAPSERPSEPLTAGMSMGPGGGPELLRTGNRVTRTFRLLAEVSADPRFAELAEASAARGR